MEKNPRLYDSRIVDRNVAKGLVKDSELKAHLAQLPDDANNLEWVSYDLEESEVEESGSDSSENNP